METVLNLNDETIDCLQNLICINIDSAEGFQAAGDAVSDDELRRLFNEIAQVRATFAEQLQAFVTANDEQPRRKGSVASKLRQVWMHLRVRFSSEDTYAVLAEAEFGEDAIKDQYQKALTATAGSPVNDVLMQQYGMIKKDHDRIRDLRDRAKEKASG